MNREEAINKIIGERIQLFRKSRKITKTKLAGMLGITQQQLDKYEKGTNRISATKLAVIINSHNLDSNYFYNDLENNNQEKSKKLNKEDVEFLRSNFLNIQKPEIKILVLELVKELAKNKQ